MTDAGGTYNVSGAGGPVVFAAGTTFWGGGRQVSVFQVTSPSSEVFKLANYHNSMSNVGFQANTTQIPGSVYVELSGPEAFVENFSVTSDYTAFLLDGSLSKLANGRLQSPSPGALRVRIEGGDNSTLIDGVVFGADSNSIPGAGIRVRNSSSATISNTEVLAQNNCLVIDPYTSTTGSATDAGPVYSLKVVNSDFDTCTTGVTIAPTGTGGVYRTRFTNSWTSSATVNGMNLTTAGSAVIKGLTLVNHIANFNVNGVGLGATGNIFDVQVGGTGEFGGNNYGMYFGSGVNGINVHGVSIGSSADSNGNRNNGVVLLSGATNIDISGNIMLNNTNGPFVDGITSAIVNKFIEGNVGYNPIARTAGSCSTSPCVIGNVTGAPLQVLFSNAGGTITTVTEDNIALPATTQSVLLPQASYVTITYSGGTTTYSQKGL